MIRIYGLSVRSGPVAMALGVAALAIGAVVIAFGIFLLLGLAAVGAVVGAGVLAFRALTGRGPGRLHAPRPDLDLDPSREVFPARQQAHKLSRSQADKLR
jgi:hypothetical protein